MLFVSAGMRVEDMRSTGNVDVSRFVSPNYTKKLIGTRPHGAEHTSGLVDGIFEDSEEDDLDSWLENNCLSFIQNPFEELAIRRGYLFFDGRVNTVVSPRYRRISGNTLFTSKEKATDLVYAHDLIVRSQPKSALIPPAECVRQYFESHGFKQVQSFEQTRQN